MFLLDTNIIIYLIAQHPTYYKNISKNIKSHNHTDIFISSIAAAELFYGAFNSARKVENLDIVARFCNFFKILDFDLKSAKIYGAVRSQAKQNNRNIGEYDIQIASIALANDLTLITNNEKDFSFIDGLSIQNWTK